MQKIAKIHEWLVVTKTVSTDKKYFHFLLRENLQKRSDILDDLKTYVYQAHEDARRRLRKLAGYTLDPLDEGITRDSSVGYPAYLDIQVLKGFFGEIMAGIVAEHFSPLGEGDWKIPAYLFRFHRVAFEQLEASLQTGSPAHVVPGRTGDDCLAFLINSEGGITQLLYCEGKCTHDHDSGMISDAHEKVSKGVPVNILELIEILSDYDDLSSKRWVESLRKLRAEILSGTYERSDLVSYICGRSPVQMSPSWIPSNRPHKGYTGNRRLQAAEIHLNGVDALVKEIYSKG